jgi:hypothetical protein
VLGAAALLAVWALVLAGARSGAAARLADAGWGPYGRIIVANKIRALWHAAFMSGCAGVALWLLFRRRGAVRLRAAVQIALLLVVAGDVLLLARHYVQTSDRDALIGTNPVVDFLKSRVGDQRVLLLDQSGFYNQWLSVLFPYHGIAAFNVLQLPRMPTDYQTFLSAVGANPVRLWQLAAVRYVLVPARSRVQMERDPGFTNDFRQVLGFNVDPGKEGLSVRIVTNTIAAQHWVFELVRALPMYRIAGAWEVLPDDRILARLPDPAFDPAGAVLISEDSPGAPRAEAHVPGRASVTVKARSPKGVALEAESDTRGILVWAQHYHPDWRATVDGQPAPVLRCNYLCMGVLLEPGRHEVALAYAPGLRGLWVQMAGFAACAVAVLSLAIRWLRGRAGTQARDSGGE